MERDSNAITTCAATVEAGNDLGVKPDFLNALFNTIYSNAVKSSPAAIRNELVIMQDKNVKSTFHIRVSSRMVPFLVKAIQDQNAPNYGVALRSYFHKMQEQILAQVFIDVKDLAFPRFS